MKKLYFLFLGIILFVPQSNKAQDIATLKINPQRINTKIKLDGILDDEAWQHTAFFSDFMQASPSQGAKPNERTECKIVYDNANIYVGIKCYDSVGKYLVGGLQRDQYSKNEDGVGVMIDTYNDKIHAMEFFTNTVGKRYDAEISDNGSGLNAAYNTFWNVKTKIISDGFCVEFEIPFSSLRFQAKELVTMGFKIMRQVSSRNEYDIFPKCDFNLGNIVMRVSTEGEMELQHLKARIPKYITPYVKANFAQNSMFNAAAVAYESKTEFMTRNNFAKNEAIDKVISNVGIDAKLGLSKNFTLDASINTDFAQAEVDSRIFNYTRYNIFLPEKRQFFLESNDYLNFEMPGQIQLFNSRNIGIYNGKITPILGGLRLTGKSKGWQIGALNMQTKGVASSNISAENFSIAHLHKDLFKNGSYCSGFFSNRISTDDNRMNNKTLGFDFLYRHNEKWTWAFNLAGTKDKFERKILDNNLVYNVAVFKTVTFGYSNFITYTKVGDKFRPESGFYADNGFDMLYGVNSYTIKLKNPRLNFFDVSTESYVKWATRNTDDIETNTHSIIPSLGFKNGMDFKSEFKVYAQDLLPFDWQFSEDIIIPLKRYSLFGNTFTWGSPFNKTYLYKLTLTTDKFYGGSRIAIQPELSNVFNKHFTVGLLYLNTHIYFPKSFSAGNNSTFSSHLFISKVQYAFNSKSSFNALLQYDSDSKTVGYNFKFRYNPREGTDFYVVYNPTVNTNPTYFVPKQPFMQQQIFIAKYARTFVI